MKLIFLIVTRAVSVLGLSRREAWWKDAEILMLRHQLAVALREQPGAHSRLTWPDRAWLALLAGTLPAGHLAGLRLIVTPDTIWRRHRDIVRRRWARLSRRGRPGRPPVRRIVRSVVLRRAQENESCGYRRIHGELAGLGIRVAPSTVWQILKDAGIDPAPCRDGPGWAEFLRAQGILALDFFTADLLNGTKVYVLAVIEHGSRRVRVLGAAQHPVQPWVVQQARNLLMDLRDAEVRAKFVLHDRDGSFTQAFDAVFQATPAGTSTGAGIAWAYSAVRAILENPRYTGRQVWNKQPKSEVLIDVNDVALGHHTKQKRNEPGEWVWSGQRTQEPLIDDDTFKQAQALQGARGSAGERSPRRTPRGYAQSGLVRCGICGHKMQGSWNNGKPHYRCTFLSEYAAKNKVSHPKSVYQREEQLLPHLDG